MYARIRIDLDNDAFQGGREAAEVARILRELAARLERRSTCESPIGLLDANGNTVGRFEITPRDW